MPTGKILKKKREKKKNIETAGKGVIEKGRKKREIGGGCMKEESHRQGDAEYRERR